MMEKTTRVKASRPTPHSPREARLPVPGATIVPGRAFRLTDEVVIELLREASASSSAISLGSSNGIPQLTLNTSPTDAMTTLLREHYADHGADLDWKIDDDTQGSAA